MVLRPYKCRLNFHLYLRKEKLFVPMDKKVDFMANLKEIDVTVKRYDPEKDSFLDQVYHVKVKS